MGRDDRRAPLFRLQAVRRARPSLCRRVGGLWLVLAGWQRGAFKCKPRELWIGWYPREQFERLDMIANKTRCPVLAERGVFPYQASFSLAAKTRRLCSDWEKAYARPAEASQAAEGKRDRVANRSGKCYREIIAFVEQGTDTALAARGYGAEGGKIAALHDLLEHDDIRSPAITL